MRKRYSCSCHSRFACIYIYRYISSSGASHCSFCDQRETDNENIEAITLCVYMYVYTTRQLRTCVTKWHVYIYTHASVYIYRWSPAALAWRQNLTVQLSGQPQRPQTVKRGSFVGGVCAENARFETARVSFSYFGKPVTIFFFFLDEWLCGCWKIVLQEKIFFFFFFHQYIYIGEPVCVVAERTSEQREQRGWRR